MFIVGDFLQDSMQTDVLKAMPEFADVTDESDDVTSGHVAMDTDSNENKSQVVKSKLSKKARRKQNKSKGGAKTQTANINIGALQNL